MKNSKPYKVDLTDEADDDLDTIHDFVRDFFGAKTAREVIKGLRDKIE